MNSKYNSLLENAPEHVTETANLFRWSEGNYDSGHSPAQLFLDLTGILTEDLGMELFTASPMADALGYLELSMLADALKEYTARPQDVTAWVEALLAADEDGEDEEEGEDEDEEITQPKTQVKRAVVAPTQTVNEFQLGEIDTPDGLSGGWSNIEDYHNWLESDLGLTITEEPNIVIHNHRGTCYRYTDSLGGFSLECVWEEDVTA